MDLVFMIIFIVISAVYMFLSIQKKKKGSFILGSVCFVIFSIMAVMVYLAQYNKF
ncbi:MAG: hypothetical protein E6344_03890 [Clostridium sp.]|uniref:hypothetical protein n=1 Tax=Clostridium culturomicium TaxID=1499683 RepID=UPI000AEAC6AB|nr:hypothetical protein [Clostridium culturomicium]MDU4889551.1 hypothetical protein [Clostridium sp.]MDU7082805.1 hypothetical protein [Clostridium sp.]